MLHIKKVTLHNILGVKDLSFEAGKFNAIIGRNASGKTSVLEAIKAAAGCGHDATLLRSGETEGEIVLVLDDDRTIRRRVTAEKSTTDLLGADGKKTAKPVDAVKALSDALSVNPVAFLRADDKDRADVLLRSMPIAVDVKRLAKISGVDVPSDGTNGLVLIDAVRKAVFDERTMTNRVMKEKDATINQLKAAMPSEIAEAAQGNEDQLRGELERANEAYLTELNRIDTKLAGLRTTRDIAIVEKRQAAQAKIAAINAELAADIAKLNADHQNVESLAAQRRTEVDGEIAATRQRLGSAIGALVADRENVIKRQQTMQTIETMTGEFVELGESAEMMTKALADIDAYKLELLENLPIPGLTVVDGKVMRNGVAFDRLNMAQQVDIAVEIAKLRAGKLGVICVDGIELMDSKMFDAFREKAIKSGLQMFVSRVADEDMAIEQD